MGSRVVWRFLPLLLITTIYLLIALDQLQVLPPVHQDEPWTASVAYKLAAQGVYGSDLFGSYHAIDRHYSSFQPTYVLLLSGVFKIFGVGLLQMRLLSVGCGLCILALTWLVGRKVGGERVGVLAMLGLVCQRLIINDNQSGVPLVDLARVTRYDIGVPVFGLVAFALYLRTSERHHDPAVFSARTYCGYLLCGVAIGVATLSHLYGAFWLPALFAAILARRGWNGFREAPVYLIAAGWSLALAPWVLYVAVDWTSTVNQGRVLSPRFDVFNPNFYLTNLINEPARYERMRLLDAGQNPLLRAGGWTALVGAPVAMAVLLRRRATAAGSAIPAAQTAISIACGVHLALFALLLQAKTYSYVIAFWPLICIMLAWGGVTLWEWKRSLLLRGALAALLAAIVIEGGMAIYDIHRIARTLTPYNDFAARLAAGIPAGTRVLGLHNYWLGLRGTTYRTWALPFLYANPVYAQDETLPMTQALELIAPEVVIIDPEMERYLKALADPDDPHHAWSIAIAGYFADHRATWLRDVVDPTYGTFHIYVLRQ